MTIERASMAEKSRNSRHQRTLDAVSAHSIGESRANPHQARVMSPCCLIQACMAIPAATPALMLRVEPN
jgi:hypothetical protein